jgi:hypothetical protein
MKTLKSIIDRNDWQNVKDTLLKLYPDQEDTIEAHQNVFEKLKTMTPKKTKMVLYIKDRIEDDGQIYKDVYGKDGRTNREDYEENNYWMVEAQGKDLDDEIDWALDFMEWNKYLGMAIGKETLEKYNELEIIASCLWDMTFYGYDEEDIQKKRN